MMLIKSILIPSFQTNPEAKICITNFKNGDKFLKSSISPRIKKIKILKEKF